MESKRKIFLLKENKVSKVLDGINNEIGRKIISSSELNSKVKLDTILDAGDAVYLKNLGIVITPSMSEEEVSSIAKKSTNILYWENEKIFYTTSELEQISEIKLTLTSLQYQIDILEKAFIKKENLSKIDSTFGLKFLGLESVKYQGEGINVAILDTGFYAEHPDFTSREIVGKSFVKGERWDLDSYGHGTHVTGTAVGNINKQTKKQYGIASKANIFIAKVLSDKGRGLTSNILDGIDWAIEMNSRVISMSLGSPVEIGQKASPIFEHVGRKALEKNSLIIAAAGNDSRRPKSLPRPVSSPGNAESIMAVAALDRNFKVASFSNAGLNASNGGRVDISAIGMNVYSSASKHTKDKVLYTRKNGTSMATPHVSGIAALYFEEFPQLSASEIWLKLEKNAKELETQFLRDVGAGLVQVIK